MHQTTTRKIYGIILLSAALLLLSLLVASMVTSSFFLGPYSNVQVEWSMYVIALVLLSIAAAGARQIRTSQAITPVSQHSTILPGLGLGLVSAIALSIPTLALAVFWATFGLPWLIVVLATNPADLSSVSPLFALISVALYTAFAVCYGVCAYRVTQRTGSVKQGMWSSTLAAMATFLSTTLLFSLIHVIATFGFHIGSPMIGLGSFSGVSPLINYLAGYRSIEQLLAVWLCVPVVLGLLIALACSFIARRTRPIPQPAPALAD